MIGEGRFQAQLNVTQEILESLEIFEERQRWPNKSLGAAHFKNLNYRQVYEESIRQFAYDFRLSDQSLLLFIKKGNDEHDGVLGFSHFECPVKVLSYREFVGDQFEVSPLEEEFESVVAELGDELRAEYEQYVTSTNSKDTVTPVRYDYDASLYEEGVHPASHIHFGFCNDIRVGTRRVMNPVSFTLFVIRQRWPESWRRFLRTAECEYLCRNVREDIDHVNEIYWKTRDELEVFLH